MAEIINFNRARKAKVRSTKKAQAAANRVIHGRTKEEKHAARLDHDRREKMLDDTRRERD
jgi:hypothetical protein